MLSEQGELIGITNYRFTDSNSPMVTSSADVVPALTAMLAGEPDAFADRRPLAADPISSYEATLEDNLHYDYFMLFAEAGDDVDLNVEGVGNPTVLIADMTGYIMEISSPRVEQMNGLVTTLYDSGPYLVEVSQTSANRNDYTLTSSHPLYVLHDADDEQPLHVGDTYIGSIDHPGDEDVFTLELEAGDRVVVQVESLAVDPFAALKLTTQARTDTTWDDDSGPTGLFGLNARFVAEAQADGEHLLFVSDAIDSSVGGYILTVTEAGENEPLTETTLSDQYYSTPRGLFEIYESPGLPFTMLFPAYYTESAECDPEVTACFESGTEALLFFEFALGDLPASQKSTDGMAAELLRGLRFAFQDAQLMSDRTIVTTQGREGGLVSVTALGNTVYASAFGLFDEDHGGFAAMYVQNLGADGNVQDVEDWLVDVVATVRVVDADHSYEEASHYLEAAMHSAAGSRYGEALGSLAMALALDKDSAYAYNMRAIVHYRLGDFESAAEDLRRAIELQPESIVLQRQLANVFWLDGDYEAAIDAYTEALDQRKDSLGIYNDRALARASAGDGEGALRDLSLYEERAADGLPLYAQDSRAYVHLKFDALDEALADYEELLTRDFRGVHTLLGAGVTYARLDRMDEALPLLEYGMEQFEAAEIEVIDPQLADLLSWAEEILDGQK